MHRLPLLHVVAAALIDADGRVLLAKRPPGRPLEGLWEFPGGKRDVGEDLAAGDSIIVSFKPRALFSENAA